MNDGGDTGNVLIRIIYLVMGHLMHDPKRAVIILLVIFIATMITGEFIGAAREAVPSESGYGISEITETPGRYFDLKEIQDLGPANLTPESQMF